MSKKRWLILRVFILLGVLCCVMICFNAFMCENVDNRESLNNPFFLGLLISLFLGIIDAILIIIIPNNAKIPKPKKYSLKQSNYEEFSSYLEDRVKEYNYELYDSNDVVNFYRKEIKRNIYFVIDVKVNELTEESFEELYNEKIFPIIDEDFIKMQDKRYGLYITMIISVDRITPMFYKYVDSGNIDRLFYKYPVGISFGSNQIYITGDEAFGFNTNKKMVKEVKEILEIEEINK